MTIKLKQRLAAFLTLTLLIGQYLPPFVPRASAVTSPWTQTSWSGETGTSVDTTTDPTQLTLTKNTEELTNTGFETDLSSWNTDMSTMIQNTQADDLVVYYPMNETTGSVASAVNPTVATGRNIFSGTNSNFDGAGSWDGTSLGTFDVNTTVPGKAYMLGNGTTDLIQSATSPLNAGKTFSYSLKARLNSGSSTAIRIGTNLSTSYDEFTPTSTEQTFSGSFTATSSNNVLYIGLSTTGFSGVAFEIDDVVVQQTSISASTSYPGSERLTNGDFENWTAGIPNSWGYGRATLIQENSIIHDGSSSVKLNVTPGQTNGYISQTPSGLVVGKRYKASVWVRPGSNTQFQINISSLSSNIITPASGQWTQFTSEFEATLTTHQLIIYVVGDGTYGYIDNASVTEVNPFNGDTSGATINQTENSLLGKSYSFDGINDYVNIYSPELNSAFDPSAGTLLAWAKVSGSGVWTDGVFREVFRIYSNGSNYLFIDKSSSNNSLRFVYVAGGVSETITKSSISSTDFLMLGSTWNSSLDEFKMYFDGAQGGSTQTGIGTWTGNISSTDTIVGASNTSASFPWSGSISHVALWKTPLSAIEIANLNGVPAYRDTSKAYSGSASVRLEAISNSNFAQFVNVGDTNKYALEAYVYTDGSAVTSSDAELYYNGSSVSTTYTDMGSGWYKLSGSVTGANESRTYGVQAKSGETLYVDDVSLNSYPASGSLTSQVFDTLQDNYWGNLTYNSTTPAGTTVAVKVRSASYSDMSGATAWASCSAVASGSDLSSSDCVTDLHRYVQYQVTLSTTDNSVTPTLSDISIAFSVASVGATLESPGNGDYTDNDRPTFKWRAGDDANTTVSSYSVELDNGISGDFAMTEIPVNRTSDYSISKYTSFYQNFSDSDLTNNFVSVTSKSSGEWNSSENDGKLKEGKREWTVKSKSTVNYEHVGSRTLFVDKTSPQTDVTQVNNTSISDTLATSDTTPTIYGKVTDPLSGETSSTDPQVIAANKVASGPKEVEVKLEKQNLSGLYDLYSLATVSINSIYWSSTGQRIDDNSQQLGDKYAEFSYTPSDAMPNGTYRVTVTGKDKVGHSSARSFLLTIGPLTSLLTPEELETTTQLIRTKVKTTQPSLTPEEQEEVVSELLEETVSEAEPSGPSFISQLTMTMASAATDLYWRVVDWVKADVSAKVTLAGKMQSLMASATGEVIDTGMSAASTIFQTSVSLAAALSQVVGDTSQTVASTIGAAIKQLPETTEVIVLTGREVITSQYQFQWQQARSLAQFAQATAGYLGQVAEYGAHNLDKGLAQPRQLANNLGDWLSYSYTSFGEIVLDKEPTRIVNVKVEYASPTSAIITWETNHLATSKVNYGSTRDYGQDVQSDQKVHHHRLEIADLTPGTIYNYEVMSKNKNYVYDANHEFTTPQQDELNKVDHDTQVLGLTNLQTNQPASSLISWLLLILLVLALDGGSFYWLTKKILAL